MKRDPPGPQPLVVQMPSTYAFVGSMDGELLLHRYCLLACCLPENLVELAYCAISWSL